MPCSHKWSAASRLRLQQHKPSFPQPFSNHLWVSGRNWPRWWCTEILCEIAQVTSRLAGLPVVCTEDQRECKYWLKGSETARNLTQSGNEYSCLQKKKMCLLKHADLLWRQTLFRFVKPFSDFTRWDVASVCKEVNIFQASHRRLWQSAGDWSKSHRGL